jgi:hypothetical protein
MDNEEDREEEEVAGFGNLRKLRVLAPIEHEGLSRPFGELIPKPPEFTYRATQKEEELKEFELDRIQLQSEKNIRMAGLPRRPHDCQTPAVRQNPFGCE